MGTGIYSIGVTGMSAAQLGLLTTEHNIANVNTPGFNRQRTIQSTNVPVPSGAGFIGQGVHVSTIERAYNNLLVNQVNQAQSGVSELDAFSAQLSQIDNLLADPSAGLSPALQDFFKGIQQVAANPSSLPARQSMVSSAQALTARFQSIGDRFSQLYDGVNNQLGSAVGTINSYAQQIAQLNQRIVVAQSAGNQPANDLLDQRDQLVAELNQQIGVTTTTNTDGTFNVFIGTGQQLVVGGQAMTLTAQPSVADPTRFTVGLKNVGGVQELPESLLTGGTVGGLLRFRSGSLDGAFNALGQVAASLALTVNAQHSLGQDLLGNVSDDPNFKANFFNLAPPAVLRSTSNTGNAVVQASFVSPPPIKGYYTLSLDGTGTNYTLTRQSDGQQWTSTSLATLGTTVSEAEGFTLDLTSVSLAAGGSTAVQSPAASGANFYTTLGASDYQLSYDGTNYRMLRLSDNRQWSATSLSALSATIGGSEGFTFSLASGALQAGDNFTIEPTRGAAGGLSVNSSIAADPRLLAAAMPFRTRSGTANTGNAQISAGASNLGFTGASIATPITLTYAGGNLSGFPAGAKISVTAGGTTTVYDGPTVPFNAGARYSVNGMSFEISGAPNAGDTFVIERNAAGVSDGRNILALGSLQTQSTMAGATSTFEATYAKLVADTGNQMRQAQVTGQAQQSLLDQAKAARDSFSGVNLDEEAANLIRYQQAYQAAAKMLDVGSKLFDTLLSIM